MAKRKWRGILSRDILTMGEALENKPARLKKGDEVVVWKRRKLEVDINDKLVWRGNYEFHYEGVNGGFARTTEFLLDNQKPI